MSKNKLITIYCFGQEVGLLGFDEDQGRSSFQYHEDFLNNAMYAQLFPFIFRHTKATQVFSRYNNETFRGLPPVIADSLPDLFGNIIFKAWMESTSRDMNKVSILEQLAYVGTRGMGALEYQPSKELLAGNSINIDEISEIVKQVMQQKGGIHEMKMDHASLLTIFKIGSSAGGLRPKILIAENKQTGQIIPGDIVTDNDHFHYLVKLGLGDNPSYSREVLEYCYFLTARKAGIEMMDARLIEGKHFATLRFDRQAGKKQHVLTVTGMTGLDYKDPSVSSYENVFSLLGHLKCPHKDTEQLFRRMVFNLVFANHDDHLKNHSLLYNELTNRWQLAPAYDITYSLNPELNFKTTSRALSVNGKRHNVTLTDLNAIAEKYSVKNVPRIIEEVQGAIPFLKETVLAHSIPDQLFQLVSKNFQQF